MSIAIKEDRIEIGIPRTLKKAIHNVSDSRSTVRLYKKTAKRMKKLEAVLEDLEKAYGNQQRFKTILDDHGVMM